MKSTIFVLMIVRNIWTFPVIYYFTLPNSYFILFFFLKKKEEINGILYVKLDKKCPINCSLEQRNAMMINGIVSFQMGLIHTIIYIDNE